jgi:hypothetical protein
VHLLEASVNKMWSRLTEDLIAIVITDFRSQVTARCRAPVRCRGFRSGNLYAMQKPECFF